MDAQTCLKKLQYVGVLAFATVDQTGAPQIRNISAIHYEPDRMIFSAKAVPVPENEQETWIDTIFAEQPYLSNVYPGGTRKLAGIVFEIRDAEIEYFHLGVNPIFRESYTIGAGNVTQKGYVISEKCTGCGKCLKNCPQGCIEPGKPCRIQQNHCLHCGNCFAVCPVKAVEQRG